MCPKGPAAGCKASTVSAVAMRPTVARAGVGVAVGLGVAGGEGVAAAAVGLGDGEGDATGDATGDGLGEDGAAVAATVVAGGAAAPDSGGVGVMVDATRGAAAVGGGLVATAGGVCVGVAAPGLSATSPLQAVGRMRKQSQAAATHRRPGVGPDSGCATSHDGPQQSPQPLSSIRLGPSQAAKTPVQHAPSLATTGLCPQFNMKPQRAVPTLRKTPPYRPPSASCKRVSTCLVASSKGAASVAPAASA